MKVNNLFLQTHKVYFLTRQQERLYDKHAIIIHILVREHSMETVEMPYKSH